MMNTYEIIERYPTEANTEIRLAKINRGYTIGTWDLDARGYASELRIYPYTLEGAKEKAEAFYREQCRLAAANSSSRYDDAEIRELEEANIQRRQSDEWPTYNEATAARRSR